MLNLNIHPHGYALDRFQKKTIQDSIDKISRRVPYDACINLNLEYSKKTFQGKMSIKVSSKTFFAKDEAETVNILMKSLEKKLSKQINKWKRLRTKKELTGIIDLRKVA